MVFINPYRFASSAPSGAYGNHAYWRVYATNNNGSTSFISLAEVVFKNGAGTTIPATGGAVLYSSQANGSTDAASKAFDGNPATSWATASGTITNSYIGYHFASAVGVEQVTLTLPPTNGNQSPKDCKLQYSDDGTTWSDAFTFSIPDWVIGQTRTFPETLDSGYHRMFRLFCTNNNGGSAFITMDEMEMRATSGGADQTASVGLGGTTAGRVTGTSLGSGNEAYRLFDNVTNTGNYWAGSSTTNQWVAFIFPNPVKVEEISLTAPNTSATRVAKDMLLQYSDDGGSTWTTQKTFASQTGWAASESRTLAAI